MVQLLCISLRTVSLPTTTGRSPEPRPVVPFPCPQYSRKDDGIIPSAAGAAVRGIFSKENLWNRTPHQQTVSAPDRVLQGEGARDIAANLTFPDDGPGGASARHQ